jgi:hypothetical protein
VPLHETAAQRADEASVAPAAIVWVTQSSGLMLDASASPRRTGGKPVDVQTKTPDRSRRRPSQIAPGRLVSRPSNTLSTSWYSGNVTTLADAAAHVVPATEIDRVSTWYV